MQSIVAVTRMPPPHPRFLVRLQERPMQGIVVVTRRPLPQVIRLPTVQMPATQMTTMQNPRCVS